ncbi:MAG TPA: RNA polymerase subunit sigma-70 [Myxococcaceae bacterium]
MRTPLASTFLAHAAVHAAWPQELELEQLLRRACDDARTARPGMSLPDERFVRHLAERMPAMAPGESLEAAVGTLSLGDLYLACACAEGLPEAITALEQEYLAKLPRQLAHLRAPDDVIDDVRQRVREMFLIRPPDGGPPGIAAYAGRGRLLSWVRVAAARVARRQITAGLKSLPEAMEDLPAAALDPELDLIRSRARMEFGPCLRDAVAALSGEERHQLRLHYSGGLSTVAMARLFGISQSTMSRKLQASRLAVLEETKRLLKERLDLSNSSLESFLGGLGSRLDLSMSQILGRSEP